MDLKDINVGDLVQLNSISGSNYPNLYGKNLVVCAVDRQTSMVALDVIFSKYPLDWGWFDYRCLVLGNPLLIIPPIQQPQMQGRNPFLEMIKQHNAANEDRIIPIVYGIPSLRKCECGAESLGYTTHSTWCDKHER